MGEALVNNLMDNQHSPPPLPRFLKLVTVNHKQPLPSTHLSPRSVTVRFKGLLLPQCHLSLKSAMDRFRFLPEFPSLRLVMDKFKSQHLLQLLLSPRSRMDRSRSPLLPPPRSLRSLMDRFRSQPSHPLQSRKSATDKSVPTVAPTPVTQIPDGQIQVPTTAAGPTVSQIPDGQVQTNTTIPVVVGPNAGNGMKVAGSLAAVMAGFAAMLLL